MKTPKPKSKKQTKAPYLAKVHILPKADQELEIVEIMKKYTKSRKYKVLIISYFNYGTPQISDVLNGHPEVFYLNEPLFPFDSTTLKDGEEPISRRNIGEAVEYLTDLFNCNILNSNLGYSEDIMRKTAKRAYFACKGNQGNVSECVQSQCKSKRVILSKTIRLYMRDLQSFLLKNKGLVKVLIMQRDPRITLHLHNKKIHPGWAAGSDLFFQGRSLCSRMLHDVLTAKRMEGSGHSNFYRIVLYEHFLKNPEQVIKGVLSFLGLTADMEEVKKLLRSANAYKELRKAKFSKWDWIPDDDAGLSIDKACSFFYKNSLYNPMTQTAGFVQRFNLCQYCD